MASRRSRQALEQAQAEAFVRFNPEGSRLLQLMRGLRSDYKLGARQESGIRRIVQRSAEKQIPKLKETYARAQDARGAAQRDLDADLARLGSAAAPYAASSARERAGHVRRMNEAEATAVASLRDRIVQAAEGEAYAVRNLRSTYQGDVAKLRERLTELGREEGAFTQGAFRSSLEAIRRDETARRGQSLTAKEKRRDRAERARHNRVTESVAQQNANTAAARAAAAGKDKSKRPGTEASRRAAQTKFDQGRSIGAMLKRQPDFAKQVRKARMTPEQFVREAVSRTIGDPLIAYAAAQATFYRGGVGTKTRQQVYRRHGIHLPKMTAPPRVGPRYIHDRRPN